jgi:transcriptional regulator with XRE-family HTH domain
MHVDRLTGIQRRDKLTDREMAARLGISRSAWNMIRRGKLPLTDRVQVRAARAFPELLPDMVVSMSTSGPQAA